MKCFLPIFFAAALFAFSGFLPTTQAAAPLSKEAVAFKEKGNRLFKKEKTFDAIKAYTQAIHAAPSYFEAYYNRGVAWHQMKLYYKAIVDFDRALEITPDDPDALYFRGISYDATGQLQRAFNDLKKASRKRHPQARRYLDSSELKKRLSALTQKRENPGQAPSATRSSRLLSEKNSHGGKSVATIFSKGDPLYEGDEGMFKQVNVYDKKKSLIKSETFHHALFTAKKGRNRTITHFNSQGEITLVEHHLTGKNLGKVILYTYGKDGQVKGKEELTLSQYQKKMKRKDPAM